MPGATASVTATTVSSSQIDLSWDEADGMVANYRIERKTGSGGTYAEITTVPDGTLSYSDADLASETEYLYRVRACNAAGCSDYSNEASADADDE